MRGGERMEGGRGDVRNAYNSRDVGKLGDALRKTRINGKCSHSQVCSLKKYGSTRGRCCKLN